MNFLETALGSSVGKMQHAINLIASRVGTGNTSMSQDYAVPNSETEATAIDEDAQIPELSVQSEILPHFGFRVKNNVTRRSDLISKSIISQKEAEGLYEL
jgi:hypothetical protein